MSKSEFKEFVKKNTYLIDYVEKNNTSWQKLYELYDLYGSDSEIWKKYQLSDNNLRQEASNQIPSNNQSNLANLGTNFKDLLNLVKGIDLNTVQKGLNSLDKAIEAFKGFVPDKDSSVTKDLYEPRPTYKYFED